MNTATIQAFLNAKVPVCDTNHAPGGGFSAPFICLKDFRQDTPARDVSPGLCNGFGAGNKSAAQIIFEVAQSCGVNPQVLIVLLQKEQGLVTDTWPWPTQYRSATGYGCPDGSPCDAEFYGFFNQVYSAAKQYKRYAMNPNNYNYRAGFNNNIPWHPNGACGTSNVFIDNKATAGLYNYTPYRPNDAALNNLYSTGDGCSSYGNRNFWRYFNDWFGTTFGTVLIKGSGPTVFVRGSNSSVAYGIPSGEIMRNYRLGGIPVTGVSDSYLSTLNTSSMLTTLYKRPLDQTVFLADSGTGYGIPSGAQCTKWGRTCSIPSLIADLPYAVTDPMTVGPPLGNLMMFDNTLFALESGAKRPFIDRNEQPLSPWAGQGIITIISPVNAAQSGGQALIYDRKFLKVMGTGSIYYHSGGSYFTFSGFENFKNWWDGSVVMSDKYSTFNSSPPAATILPGFATTGSETSMVGSKNRLVLPGSTTAPSINTTTYPQLTNLIQSKPVVTVNDTKALAFPNGAIVTVRGNTFRPIPTLADLRLLFAADSVIPVPMAFLEAYPVGKLFVTSGRVVKPNEAGGSMYLYGSDNYLWALGNLGELSSSLAWTNSVINAPFNVIEHQGIKIFASMMKMNGNYYAVQPNGAVRQLAGTLLSANKDNIAMPVTDVITSKVANDTRPVGFIRLDNGTIFKVESSSIRPIGALSTYFSLGGNGANTIHMSVKAVSAFNVGSPL